jgi:hypothetical protein
MNIGVFWVIIYYLETLNKNVSIFTLTDLKLTIFRKQKEIWR